MARLPAARDRPVSLGGPVKCHGCVGPTRETQASRPAGANRSSRCKTPVAFRLCSLPTARCWRRVAKITRLGFGGSRPNKRSREGNEVADKRQATQSAWREKNKSLLEPLRL